MSQMHYARNLVYQMYVIHELRYISSRASNSCLKDIIWGHTVYRCVYTYIHNNGNMTVDKTHFIADYADLLPVLNGEVMRSLNIVDHSFPSY